ncbi:MAG TPA: 7-cyano-7-deazaguanine synthase QueC [Spirochaetota bacterium]|nr:7-cyano-7-deazaguanine synthase QueC [Spirochaetota bacterium]HOD14030.1 7-cyano-7-deazaguanine synthase QueC [Spirochaetota bacterium]HPG52428.1 7-cyano-7-deazaguanine synthase QueC [Spirochaetota bacterium]HPN13986.1 7-cyano-7-deazaguanine synthase QueC [Spirochaetota bacterium]HQL82716.1 7-cyano-7-deazaguanine synthase QueC [Spirochaetota bacterium]
MQNKKAIILLSGGIDSATTAAIAIDSGFALTALTFSYGQKHAVEVIAAGRIARSFSMPPPLVIDIPARIFRSALTDAGLSVPKNRDTHEDGIPDTYVPARNILFLSYALAFAESAGARHIFIGATAVDYSGYPDCRPEFFRAFQEMANRGTRSGVDGDPFAIITPVIGMSKSEIIKKGASLGVDFALTHSCYDPDPDGLACGSCDSCQIRKKGFLDAGVADPTRYRHA